MYKYRFDIKTGKSIDPVKKQKAIQKGLKLKTSIKKGLKKYGK